jgi:hypothetical protein
MIYTDQVKGKLKRKYPAVYGKFETGTAGLEELRWLIDNIGTFMDKKNAYTVLKESQLESVDKKGLHKYKQ